MSERRDSLEAEPIQPFALGSVFWLKVFGLIVSTTGLVVGGMWALSHAVFMTRSEARDRIEQTVAKAAGGVKERVTKLEQRVQSHDEWAKDKTDQHSKEFDKVHGLLEEMREDQKKILWFLMPKKGR